MPHVYLLHFTQPYHHARHYIGMTSKPVADRLAAHRGDSQHGRAAKLLAALQRDGGDFILAASWETATTADAYDLERKLKRYRAHARLCPICSPTSGHGAQYSPRSKGVTFALARNPSEPSP